MKKTAAFILVSLLFASCSSITLKTEESRDLFYKDGKLIASYIYNAGGEVLKDGVLIEGLVSEYYPDNKI
ncbi:MAG TPA: hypothetical protein PKJ42_07615, partial [Candidatus Goldiibacteriota bacterium]|nr:hypothetical protein [Candidatus Goldiibacteriota bacterium]